MKKVIQTTQAHREQHRSPRDAPMGLTMARCASLPYIGAASAFADRRAMQIHPPLNNRGSRLMVTVSKCQGPWGVPAECGTCGHDDSFHLAYRCCRHDGEPCGC